mmetsp:Transcript_9070/g.21069  ORF Transcript_9070/g.21069 Transcript_9070/m.21069 type:complete len:88 (+) Transcript_9070:356-619(+)
MTKVSSSLVLVCQITGNQQHPTVQGSTDKQGQWQSLRERLKFLKMTEVERPRWRVKTECEPTDFAIASVFVHWESHHFELVFVWLLM